MNSGNGRKKLSAHRKKVYAADADLEKRDRTYGKRRALMLASVASMIDQFNMQNIRLLTDMGYEVHVACNFKEGNTCDAKHITKFRRKLTGQGIVCHQWDCPRDICAAKCFRTFAQLWRLMGTYRFEMIHCHSPAGGALARIAAHLKGVFVIYTAHGFHFYKGAPVKNWLLYYPAEKLLSYWTDVLVTVNREDYAFARRYLNASKIFRIPGVGINAGRFASAGGSARAAFRRKYGIAPDTLLLLSAGELNEGKNHRVVLETVAQLKYNDQKKNVSCLICGIGKLREWLAEYALGLGIAKQVILPGYVEDMVGAYAAADIFVFPSKREGMPAALMEAMAAGLPVIASDIRGCRELVDAAGGRLLGPEDSSGFAAAAAELAERKEREPERFQAMGMYNRARIAGSYDISCVSEKMLRIYDSCRTQINEVL